MQIQSYAVSEVIRTFPMINSCFPIPDVGEGREIPSQKEIYTPAFKQKEGGYRAFPESAIY